MFSLHCQLQKLGAAGAINIEAVSVARKLLFYFYLNIFLQNVDGTLPATATQSERVPLRAALRIYSCNVMLKY